MTSPAEETLRGLGITDPKDIDIEAIAWCLGVDKILTLLHIRNGAMLEEPQGRQTLGDDVKRGLPPNSQSLRLREHALPLSDRDQNSEVVTNAIIIKRCVLTSRLPRALDPPIRQTEST